METAVTADPFETLGLPARADVTDDDVRAAWRRIAAATHPDRDDGGDPARFAVAAAAYAALRTSYGRGEALADMRAHGTGSRLPLSGGGLRGRTLLLGARALGAAAVGTIAVLAAGWTPGAIGVLTGTLTWLAATGRHDLARRGGE
jgi:hypothetical protein